MTEYLKPKQIAKRLGVSPRTVQKYLANGRLKAKRDMVTKAVYVPVEEVERFERELADYDGTREHARRPRRAVPAPEPAPPGPVPQAAPAVASVPVTAPPQPTPAPPAETRKDEKPQEKTSKNAWTLFG